MTSSDKYLEELMNKQWRMLYTAIETRNINQVYDSAIELKALKNTKNIIKEEE